MVYDRNTHKADLKALVIHQSFGKKLVSTVPDVNSVDYSIPSRSAEVLAPPQRYSNIKVNPE